MNETNEKTNLLTLLKALIKKTPKTVKIVVTSVICTTLVIGFGYLHYMNNKPEETGDTLGDYFRKSENLVTVEFGYTYKKDKTDYRKFMNTDFDIPLTKNEIAVLYQGNMNCGVNLSNISNPIINDLTKTITFEMPELILISHEYDDGKVDFYYQDNNILNAIKAEDGTNLIAECKKEKEKEVLKDRNFITSSQKTTEDVIQKLIADNFEEYKDYDVELDFPEQTEIKRQEESFYD